MKLKQLNQIGMLVALAALSACSKQSGQSTSTVEATPQSQDAAISLRGVYSISLNGAAYLITDLENTGKSGIVAFQAKWAIKDDLDATIADLEVRYTSDTPYATPDGVKSSHVIAPGEKFVVVNQGVSGEEDKVYAAAKDNIGLLGIWTPNATTLTATNMDDYRVTKKVTFEVEKIVTQ
jgi:hypothetical protein